MKPIRMSVNLPRELHGKLREAAARKGCSMRALMLAAIERTVAETVPVAVPVRPRRRLNLDVSIIPPAGRKLGLLSNEELYELIEFP